MLAQGVGKLPVFKLDGRGRPKVKAVKVWIKELAGKRFTAPSFAPALEMLRKSPNTIKRGSFADIYICHHRTTMRCISRSSRR